jgi:Tol biopolymer transport system component
MRVSIRFACTSAVIAIGVATACSASWGSRHAEDEVTPVHPTGPVAPAARSSLRGTVAYGTPDGDIWVMNATGTERRRVTRSGPGHDFDPSLSPDGRAVVFRTSRGGFLPDTRGIGLEGIFVVDVRTRREHPVHPPRGGLFPSWSPDGTAIAFSTLQRDLQGESIHLVTPAGKRLRDLAEPSFDAVQEGLAWSPDSRRIAYSGHSGDGNWALWVMNRDGSGRRQLTFPTPVAPRGSGGDHIASWSPDGRRLVYSSGQGGGIELYVINADGSGAYRLTDWPGADAAGTWLRSGEIVFAHFAGDEPLPKWYLVRPDGTRLRSLPWFFGAGDPLDWVQPR